MPTLPTNFAAILCLLTLFSNFISCSNLLFFYSILPTLIYILSFLFVVSLLPHFLIHHQQLSRPLQPCVSSFSMHYLNTLALFPALQPSSLTRSQPTIQYFCDHCNHTCLTFTCILQIIRVVSGLATSYTNPALSTNTNLSICVPRSTPTTTTFPNTGRPYQCFFSSRPATSIVAADLLLCPVVSDMI